MSAAVEMKKDLPLYSTIIGKRRVMIPQSINEKKYEGKLVIDRGLSGI